MLLHDYLRILRRGWWVIVGLATLGALIGAGLSALASPVYEARATIYVSTVGDGTPGALQQGNVFAMQRVATYADLAMTASVLDRVAAGLGDGTNVEQLRGTVTSSARAEKSLIDIFAQGDDPAATSGTANAVAESLTLEVAELEAPGAAASPVQLTVVEPAIEPSVAVTPQPRTNALVGAAVGVLLGIAVLVVRNALDNRIRTPSDVPPPPGQQPVSVVPRARRRGRTAAAQDDRRLEGYRSLRANLQFGSRMGKSLAIAPAEADAEALDVSTQLARTLGEIGYDVLVVDADLSGGPVRRRDRRAVGAGAPVPGLADVLAGTVELTEALQAGPADNVSVLAAGSVERTSAQRLSTPVMLEVLGQLSGRFDYVLLSCPPLGDRSEAAVLCAMAESTLVVLRAGVSTTASYRTAIDALAGVGVGSVSVVLDGVRDEDALVVGDRGAVSG